MATNENFYSDLQDFSHFRGICNLENYTKLPNNWLIVITDIKDSTQAIQQGQYRAVNAVGVASIIAILNALKPLSIPFVFGGDGAYLCVPQSCIDKVKNALLATQQMAEENFSLTLRCGLVPCNVIHQSKHQVLIAKHRVSKGYFQASFIGDGMAYTEQLVKDDTQGLYCIATKKSIAYADYTGFECRWKDVPSPYDETVTLLIRSITNTIEHSVEIYREVLHEIQKIYGSAESYKPVQKNQLVLTSRAVDLQDEIKIRTLSKSKLGRLIYAGLLLWTVRLGQYLMNKEARSKEDQSQATDWGNYKDTLVANTDFRKFDDNLRMVICGSTGQRKALKQYLQLQYQKGLLVYGMHVSDRALMTCMIADYNLNHIHFVDGADGGYAMAATKLKQQETTASKKLVQ